MTPNAKDKRNDEPHITVSYKDIDYDRQGLHQTVHGILRPNGSFRASLGRYAGSDAHRPVLRVLCGRKAVNLRLGDPSESSFRLADNTLSIRFSWRSINMGDLKLVSKTLG